MYRIRPIAMGLLLWLLLGLLGCRQSEEIAGTATASPSPTSTRSLVRTTTPQPTATASPTATATPTATPVPPALRVENQPISEEGLLTVAEVTVPEDGWVAVSSSTGGWLAAAPVAAGLTRELVLEVDPYQSTTSLTATLYQDLGETGVWELPDIDHPFTVNGAAVSQSFEVSLEVTLPALTVADQRLDEDGLVRIDEVTVPFPAWVVVANQDQPEQPLGMSRVDEGITRELQLHIPWRQAELELMAFLAMDGGVQGMYDPEEGDVMVEAGGQPMVVPFQVSLPPDIFIFDQQLTATGEIAVERVIVEQPAWLVLRQDVDGELGNAVGEILLQPGVNERLRVPVVEEAVTDLMFAVLHRDAGEAGVFDFPGEDGLLPYEDASGFRYYPRFPFRTNTASYLVAADQPEADSVLVPYVMAAEDAWLVIREDANGEPGNVLASTLLAAGFHWDVEMVLEREPALGQLYAGLHLDNGTAGVFEFPEADPPLQVAGRDVVASFRLTASEP